MITILLGDALTKLRELPNESVQCCVTSPPFWGLRDYGTAKWEGGGSDCDHVSHEIRTGLGMAALGEQYRGGGHKASEIKTIQFANDCGKCGAKRIDAQLGLEKTPEQYVAKLVEVFREVRRVLRNDGTFWLNLGDSYAGSGKGSNPDGTPHPSTLNSKSETNRGCVNGLHLPQNAREIGLKSKDLVGIPWMVAFALRADGWWLRSDIIWAKPNPMPESVTDRPTKSHEYIFLLTKSARYFYNADSIAERGVGRDTERPSNGRLIGNPSTKIRGGNAGKMLGVGADFRNKRSVWVIPTWAFPEAHFATYPPDLIKPCILAGTKPGDVVLDPFAGSGTTGQVALELGRKAILVELNPKYVALIEQRASVTMGLAI